MPPPPPHQRHNLTFCVLNGAFFGLAIGLASFVSVMPLFVRSISSSAIALALIPWLQPLGWHVPQLLLVRRVARLHRFHPAVLRATIVERLPFLGLAVLALSLPWLPRQVAVGLTLTLLLVFGLGGGLTAPPWQSLLVRMTESRRRGAFIGIMVGAVQLMAAIGAWSAGRILERFPDRMGFALCFGIGTAALVVSYGFLSRLREPLHPAAPMPVVARSDDPDPLAPSDVAAADLPNDPPPSIRSVWQADPHFRRFVAARLASWFALMPAAFFAVDAQARLGATLADIGTFGALFALVQVVLSPALGWLADNVGHRRVMAGGAIAAGAAALLAAVAPTLMWIGAVFILAGAANIALTMIPLVYILTFGDARTRPAYIGLGHSLATPALVLAPLIGGALARATDGYVASYSLAVIAAAVTAALLLVDRQLTPGRRPPRDAVAAVGV